MPELHDIPLTYKEGVYSVVDFSRDIDGNNAISFDYDAQYQILTYYIPVGKGGREMTLYSVPEDDLIRTLRVVYGKDETLQNVTVTLNGHETLLYIHYENEEHAKQEIRRFAIRNAESLIFMGRCVCLKYCWRLFVAGFPD